MTLPGGRAQPCPGFAALSLATCCLAGSGGDVATLLVHSGVTSPEMVAQLRLGVTLPGGRAQPCPGFAAPSLATLLGCLLFVCCE